MEFPPDVYKGVCFKRLTNRFDGAFTLIELIVVITVIIILTGLVLSTVGYAQKKGARARAETDGSANGSLFAATRAARSVLRDLP